LSKDARVPMQPAKPALPVTAAIDKPAAACAVTPLPARREFLYILGPMALLRSVATVGGYTMMSRILGFAREVLTAAFLGAGPVADAFFVALRRSASPRMRLPCCWWH